MKWKPITKKTFLQYIFCLLFKKPRARLVFFLVQGVQLLKEPGGGGNKNKINKNIHLLNERCFNCFDMDYKIQFKKIFFLQIKMSSGIFSSQIFFWGVSKIRKIFYCFILCFRWCRARK